MSVTLGDVPSFGTLLKTFRQRRRLTQQQLADALGMHRHAIGRWEQGDFLPASKTIVLELARQLQLDEAETRSLLEASLTALSPFWSVPLPRNPYFTGREEVLQTVHLQLGRKQAVALTHSAALSGLGGVGKTQIALEYAYRHALDYRAVFWIGAETLESILASLLQIAEVLHLPERDDQDQQRVLAAVGHWLTTHADWLVIWDNLEDFKLLTRFLPTGRQGALLLTTRCQALGTLARGIDLEPMGKEEGVLLLLRRAKLLEPHATLEHVHRLAKRNPVLSSAATQLVSELGGLPLALDQAGAYIEETGCSLAQYVQRYSQKRQVLLDRRGLASDHPLSVVATVRLACQRVAEQQPAALELLCCCAFLSAEAIPEELLLTDADELGPVLGPVVTDATAFDLAVATLRRYSLVQRHPDTRTLSLHRLVQVILQEELSREEQDQWRRRLVHLLNTVFPFQRDAIEPALWGQSERLLPHVMTCTATIPEHLQDQELADLLGKAADYLVDRSQIELAPSLYQRALSIQEQLSGPVDPKVAVMLERLGHVHNEMGNYPQAESLLTSAIGMLEQTLGRKDLAVASPLSLLALVYRLQGKFDLAESVFQRAIAIQEKTLGPDHLEVARSLNWMGTFYVDQRKYDLAESVYQRALSIREQALGSEHPKIAYMLNNLGNLYRDQGKFEQAEGYCQRAVRLIEQVEGPEGTDMAGMLDSLAELYCAWRKYALAEPIYRRCLLLCEQSYGPEHRFLAYPLRGLGILCRDQGRFEEAEALFQRALQIREQVLGEDKPKTAQVLHDLALLHEIEGKVSEARSLAERALAIRTTALGDAHPETLATRSLHTQLVQREAGTAAQSVATESHRAPAGHL